MSKTLGMAGAARLLVPTTTVKVASRILCAIAVVSDRVRDIGGSGPALEILLSLYAAEEEARYLLAAELDPTGSASAAVTERWLALLVRKGLVERRGDILALSTQGHATVTDLIEAVYLAQRELD